MDWWQIDGHADFKRFFLITVMWTLSTRNKNKIEIIVSRYLISALPALIINPVIHLFVYRHQ